METEKDSTAVQEAASETSPEVTFEQLAVQISGPEKTTPPPDTDKAANKAKVSEKPDPEEEEAEEAEEVEEETEEAEEEDETKEDEESEDETDEDEEEKAEEDESEEDESESLTVAEQALDKAIADGKLPVGLIKRLAKSKAKEEEAIERAATAEKQLAEIEGKPAAKVVGSEIAAIETAAELREFEKKAIAVKDFCEDQLELLAEAPESVQAALEEHGVKLDSYDPVTMKKWLVNMRGKSRTRLSDDIPERREQLAAEREGYKVACDLYPALKDSKSKLAVDVEKIIKKLGRSSDPEFNAQRHHIAVLLIRGRQAEVADLEAAKVKGKKTVEVKPKPKVKSPVSKGGAGASKATLKERAASNFKKVETRGTEASFSEALAESM